MLEHARLELIHLVGIAAEQRQLIELRADRAFQAAHGITREQLFNSSEGHEQLLSEHRETLAQRGGLSRDVVRAPRNHQVAMCLRLLREGEQGGCGLEMNEL